MPTRRPLLALPLLLAARPVWAAAPSWRAEISELRVAGADAPWLQEHLGVLVRSVTAGLAEALNEGHLEAALLDPAVASRAAGLMGGRLLTTAAGKRVIAIRQALPAGLRADLAAALSLVAA